MPLLQFCRSLVINIVANLQRSQLCPLQLAVAVPIAVAAFAAATFLPPCGFCLLHMRIAFINVINAQPRPSPGLRLTTQLFGADVIKMISAQRSRLTAATKEVAEKIGANLINLQRIAGSSTPLPSLLPCPALCSPLVSSAPTYISAALMMGSASAFRLPSCSQCECVSVCECVCMGVSVCVRVCANADADSPFARRVIAIVISASVQCGK